MPSFTWTGYLREGQWRAFRQFVLEERRDTTRRVLAISSELDRIGRVRVIWETGKEQRKGFQVDEGSSLEKLLSAYVSMGGNPYDISMFLTPEEALPVQDVEAVSSQPGGGVASGANMVYSYAAGITSSDVKGIRKFQPSRVGGIRRLPEAQVGSLVDRSRKWVKQEIQFKRNSLETRILKLCDLREQLLQELEDIAWAMFGEGVETTYYDSNRYDDSQTVAGIVFTFDSIFRNADQDGRVEYLIPPGGNVDPAEPGMPNQANLAIYPNLMTDDPEEGDNAL